MNRLLAIASIPACILVAGCASAPLTKDQVDGQIVCNTDQMDQVERAARRSFAELRWVHCPTATLRVM